MKATIHITLKAGVLDPQGKAIETALHRLGFAQVIQARQGKLIEIDLDESDATIARATLKDMCEQMLANTVIEDYEITLHNDK